MGYQDYSAAGGVFFQGLEDDAFVKGIQIGGWFIQKQKGAVMEDALAMPILCFSPPERVSPEFPDFCVITFG